jgi:LmbE family N-acetylglucosaminyl deacetylase
MATVAFVHAHPDDEAIFTGATMARLAAAGHRVVLVVATGGELGLPADDPLLAPEGDPRLGPSAVGVVPTVPEPAPDVAELAAHRRRETDAAAAVLGVDRVAWLGYADSGMAGDPANHRPGSLWSAGAEAGARALVAALAGEAVDAIVGYDPGGIYGHPDHVRVHAAARLAARELEVAVTYEATVDREHLHFVETHLVEEALGGDLGLVRSRLGTPTVEIATTLLAGPALEAKREAMAAHASQIPPGSPALALGTSRFAEVYGLEWYLRHGPPGPLDDLG